MLKKYDALMHIEFICFHIETSGGTSVSMEIHLRMGNFLISYGNIRFRRWSLYYARCFEHIYRLS
jgi:hypothetical protein